MGEETSFVFEGQEKRSHYQHRQPEEGRQKEIWKEAISVPQDLLSSWSDSALGGRGELERVVWGLREGGQQVNSSHLGCKSVRRINNYPLQPPLPTPPNPQTPPVPTPVLL